MNWRSSARGNQMMIGKPGPMPRIVPEARYLSIPFAVVGAEARVQEMEALARQGRYPSAPVVPAFARGFLAFARQDWAGAIAAIEPLLDQRERICGSRAQVDLVEFTLLKAYLNAGRLDDVQRLLRERRAGAVVMPIAGLPALH